MATEYIGLPGHLVARVREAAAKKSISPEDFFRDAVETRLKQTEWAETVQFGHRNALEKGLRPEDVEIEISAVRSGQTT